jgi:hypothetical protein
LVDQKQLQSWSIRRMKFETVMFDVQLKVGGDWRGIMGVRRIQDKAPLLHITPCRRDML